GKSTVSRDTRSLAGGRAGRGQLPAANEPISSRHVDAVEYAFRRVGRRETVVTQAQCHRQVLPHLPLVLRIESPGRPTIAVVLLRIIHLLRQAQQRGGKRRPRRADLLRVSGLSIVEIVALASRARQNRANLGNDLEPEVPVVAAFHPSEVARHMIIGVVLFRLAAARRLESSAPWRLQGDTRYPEFANPAETGFLRRAGA